MNFQKFGAFPDTGYSQSKKTQQNLPFLELIKLLPSLLKNKTNEPTSSKSEENSEKTTQKSANAKAYAEYVAKHNAHLSSIHERK